MRRPTRSGSSSRPTRCRVGAVVGRVLHPRRDIVDAIRYLDHNSCVWRALPAVFPPWHTVYRYFRPGCVTARACPAHRRRRFGPGPFGLVARRRARPLPGTSAVRPENERSRATTVRLDGYLRPPRGPRTWTRRSGRCRSPRCEA
ncbi:MAG: transposase [Actinophytocola sp.]|uniref:transposase n=1 Tax=Actinophytocola sp. TaxID=1872138 RepID=UPI003D6ACC1D